MMMRSGKTSLILALALVTALGGCTSIKRATGQLDDSVLPGQRENVLPPEQQQARDPGVTGREATGTMADDGLSDDSLQSESPDCLPEEPNCISQQPVKPKKGSATVQ
jgi:hypothetical protein